MKKTLLCTVSAITLSTGLATGAMAFDKVDWDWKLDAETDIKIDIEVDVKVDPDGATVVEVDQDFKGDLDAKAITLGVVNDPADSGHHKWNWHDDGLDAVTELPSVENTAAAIGNSVSIESEVATLADINQTASDGYHQANFDSLAVTALVFNATVENTAQTVGNSASITLDPENSDEDFLIANIDQYANFDGTATAITAGVFIEGYNNMGLGDGALGRAIVDNTAIAVGNVANITVLEGSLGE